MSCEKTHKFFSMYGGLLTRIVVGLIFLIAGFGKLFGVPGIEGFSGMLSGMGFPIPTVLTIIVGIVELVGGLFLIIGLFTKQMSILLAIIMLVAIFSVHIGQGWNGVKYPLLLFVLLLAYMGQDPGLCSISKKRKPRRPHRVVEVEKPASVKKKTAKKKTPKKKTVRKTTRKKR